MRAYEFINEAAGTFYHGTRHDYDFKDISAGHGAKTFDRILGPHFADDPGMANKFALGDPQTQNAKDTDISGARVFPVTIPGEVYSVHQPPGVYDSFAILIDAVKKVVFQKQHLFNRLVNGVTNKLVVSYPDKTVEEMSGHIRQAMTDLTEWRKGITWGENIAATYIHQYAPVTYLEALASQYKQALVSSGYGVIQYKNTNSRETSGTGSKWSYIALSKPVSKFEKNTDESIRIY